MPDLLNAQNSRLIEQAVGTYKVKMQERWPADSDPEPVHTSLQNSMYQTLQNELIYIRQSDQLLQQWNERTNECFQDISKEKSIEMLTTLLHDVASRISNGHYLTLGGCDEYEADIESVKSKYKAKKNLGPMSPYVWNEYEGVIKQNIHYLRVKREKQRRENLWTYQNVMEEENRRRNMYFEAPEDRRRNMHFEAPEGRRRNMYFEAPEDRRRNMHFEAPEGRRRNMYFEAPEGRRRNMHFEAPEGRRRNMHFEAPEDRRRNMYFEAPEDRRRNMHYEESEESDNNESYTMFFLCVAAEVVIEAFIRSAYFS